MAIKIMPQAILYLTDDVCAAISIENMKNKLNLGLARTNKRSKAYGKKHKQGDLLMS